MPWRADTSIGMKQVCRLDRETVEARVRGCARLPSLRTVHDALGELLNADQRYTHQIAEIIRRDPSFTARLLRLVNSVYYGFYSEISNIEEAVFYLGIRQIRQLAMATPVIEDFQRLAGETPFRWREFWHHCVRTAQVTGEVISMVRAPMNEAEYLAGLIHDVGKIVMASAFPEEFAEIHAGKDLAGQDLIERELELLGISHAELGGMYLEQHNLPGFLVESARFHHSPRDAARHGDLAGAVQIADWLARRNEEGADLSERGLIDAGYLEIDGWQLILPGSSPVELALAGANLRRSMERLPASLDAWM